MPTPEVTRREVLGKGPIIALIIMGGIPLAFNVNEFFINPPHPEKISVPSWSEADREQLSMLANSLSPYIGVAEEIPFQNDAIARAVVGLAYQWHGLEEARGVVASLTDTPPTSGAPHKSIIFRPMTSDEAANQLSLFNPYTDHTGKEATNGVGYGTITVDTPTGSFEQNVYEVHPQLLSILRNASDAERQAFTPAFIISAFGGLIDGKTNEQLKLIGKACLITIGGLLGFLAGWTAGAGILSLGKEQFQEQLQGAQSRRQFFRTLLTGDVLATTGTAFFASGLGSVVNICRLIGNMLAQRQFETGDTLLLTPDGKLAVQPQQGFVTSNPQLLTFVGKLIQ